MGFDQLVCTDEGSGAPLVLLHAFPLNRRMWEAQVDFFRDRYRVIAPDYYGFGDSPAAAIPFPLESLADDLAALLDSKGIRENISLVGLSMGGYLAFEFLRKYQSRLRTLILAATHPALDSEAGRQARLEMAEWVRETGGEGLGDKMIPRLIGRTTQATRPAVVSQVRFLISSNSPEGVAHASRAMAGRRDSIPLLSTIQVPTLIISGDEDVVVPGMPPDILQQHISGSTRELIPLSGHLVNLETPARFNQILEGFLSAIS
jgi:3-oxoadipate enol-lactonase